MGNIGKFSWFFFPEVLVQHRGFSSTSFILQMKRIEQVREVKMPLVSLV